MGNEDVNFRVNVSFDGGGGVFVFYCFVKSCSLFVKLSKVRCLIRQSVWRCVIFMLIFS